MTINNRKDPQSRNEKRRVLPAFQPQQRVVLFYRSRSKEMHHKLAFSRIPNPAGFATVSNSHTLRATGRPQYDQNPVKGGRITHRRRQLRLGGGLLATNALPVFVAFAPRLPYQFMANPALRAGGRALR